MTISTMWQERHVIQIFLSSFKKNNQTESFESQ